MEEKLDEIEKKEEEIVTCGGKLVGSMVGRRRVLTTWAVGEAWEVFCRERTSVIQRSFRAVGLALPIDGSHDHEISIKGLESSLLIEGLKDWQKGGIIDDENDKVELDEKDDERDGVYHSKEEI